MFNNYFYLFRSVYELKKVLCGCRIVEIYSQEKNLLYLNVPSEEFPNRHLIISTNFQAPYLLLKNQHNKAKKNVINFFVKKIPAEILNIQIAYDDRLVKIDLDTSIIIFIIKGKNTNVHLIGLDSLESTYKKTSLSIANEIKDIRFGNNIDFLPLHEDKDEYNGISDLKKKYPMISNEIRNEILFRMSNRDSKKYLQTFKDLVNEIFYQNIRVGFNNDLGKVVFTPDSFSSLKTDDNSTVFDSFNPALHYFISSSSKQINSKDISKELEKYFDKELTKLANKCNKLKIRVDSGSKENIYYNNANLLLANIYMIKKGMDKIYVNDLSTNKSISIKIDPKLGPQNNVTKYFEKARDEKVSYRKSIELYRFTKEKFDNLKKIFDKFINSDSFDEINQIYQQVLHKKEKIIKMNSGLKFKYWHYVLEDNYNVFIGRDSKSNDYLSVKFAKQNDYWFHARGLPGSHVVLRVENVKEGVPKNIIKNAASLAAYHSKAKTAGTAPVSYTVAKYVYKKKGMAPGKVLLTKEKTLLVKPEIPKNCQLVNE